MAEGPPLTHWRQDEEIAHREFEASIRETLSGSHLSQATGVPVKRCWFVRGGSGGSLLLFQSVTMICPLLLSLFTLTLASSASHFAASQTCLDDCIHVGVWGVLLLSAVLLLGTLSCSSNKHRMRVASFRHKYPKS